MTRAMDDKAFEKLIKTIDTEERPPEGLKEKLFSKTMSWDDKSEAHLTAFERLIFGKPLRAAGAISIFISGALWAVLGNDFAKLLTGIIG